MKKVSIITRAYNKLEYTIRCIESVARYTTYTNYEHIIINNNSNDGTKEWLNWMDKHGLPYYDNLKPFNMDKNYGDWGGMIKSLDLISEDSEYIVQMDNDIEILDPDWIQKMMLVLDTNVNIIQLKRIGMKNMLVPQNPTNIEYNGEMLSYGISPARRPVGFFMLKTEDFKRVKSKLPLNLNKGKTVLSQLLGGTYKFSNVGCNMIDAYYPPSGKNFFQHKYPIEETYQNNNFI
jgi:glycosyltransferase involved in cell wall biosynthesis